MPYDVFISYSHFDNIMLKGKQQGWVDRFHEALKKNLREFLGRTPQVFRDKSKMQGYERLNPAIYDAIQNSLLFVPILSPNFLTSKWCPNELTYFCDNNMSDLNGRSQVFPIVKTPVKKVPIELTDHLLKFKFFLPDDLTEDSFKEDELIFFDPDLGVDLEQQFYLKISDFARRIAGYVNDLRIEEIPAIVPPLPKNEGPCIYLAEPSPDLWEEYEDIKRDLEQRNNKFLPDLVKDVEKPEEIEEYQKAVKADIDNCSIVVNLVGKRHTGYPPESNLSYQQLQMEVAGKRDGESDFKRLIWLPSDLEGAGKSQQKLIEEIRHSSTKGVEFLQGSLEEFKTSIQDALKPPAPPPPPSPPDDPPWVYVVYDVPDLECSRKIEKLLEEQNYGIFPNREYLEGALKGDINTNNAHEEWLTRCDAVLIYWNLAPPMWVRNSIYELQKIKAKRNGKNFRAQAIFCDGEIESEQKSNFRSPLASLLKVRGYSELPLFLSRLEVQSQ